MSKLQRFLQAPDKFQIVTLKIRSLTQFFFNHRITWGNYKWLVYRNKIITSKAIKAPFYTNVYYQALQKIMTDSSIYIGPLQPRINNKNGPMVILRHDIDFKECVENLDNLTSIEEDLGLFSSIVFRVDGLDYNPESCINLVKKHKESGHQIGLHSTAYINENPVNALLLEINKFHKLFGFYPLVYNFHGGNDKHLAKRMSLGLRSDEILSKYPFIKETDSTSGYYDYRISDCILRKNKRVIFDDIITPPVDLITSTKAKVLLLTHPCYWPSRL